MAKFTYAYPRPSVTADVVMLSMRASDLAVLLIKRKHDPFAGAWALPGGFVNENEALERAALRELHEETGISGAKLEQLGAFGDPGRDPRGHTVTVAFVTFVVAESVLPKAADDAAEVAWHPLRSLQLPSSARKKKVEGKKPERKTALVPLAFDHGVIIEKAVAKMRERLVDPLKPARFDLVPPRFTLAELQRVYELILGRTFDKRNFRAKLLSHGVVEPVAAQKTGRHRPAQLYRYKAYK